MRPFAGLIRDDARDLPMVFLPGALYVTQTSLRRDSGTAYTTKELADEVVLHALEPLVYAPGPAETADSSQWRLRSARDILALKVCDPAVGSGAILVAACRYLADRLVEAWAAGDSPGVDSPDVGPGLQTRADFQTRADLQTPADIQTRASSQARGDLLTADDLRLRALRLITDHCLYGVDRNPMAVEMAKLSLWLTTLAKERPFTFLDHQVRCGDSLLGITSLDEMRAFHIDPTARARKASAGLFPRSVIDDAVDRGLALARELQAIEVVTVRDVERCA